MHISSNIDNNKNVFPIKCSSDLISFVWLDTVQSAASNFGSTFAYDWCLRHYFLWGRIQRARAWNRDDYTQ